MTKPRHSAVLEYRKRSKTSECRKLGESMCRSRKNTCKYANGKKRQFCRKIKNATRRIQYIRYKPKK